MALNKQIHLYGIDTSYFYFPEEYIWHKRLSYLFLRRSEHKKQIVDLVKLKNKLEKNKVDGIDSIIEYENMHNEFHKEKISEINKILKKYKNKLVILLKKNKNKKRILNSELLKKSDIISVFESSLTRLLECETNEITTDLFIVQTYYYEVTESLIKNNFIFNNKEYTVYTSSSGQIRLKKFVSIKKEAYEKIYNSLSCGLSIEKINSNGGVNTNKYLAYLALQNSATDWWINFDIDKTIVVDDFETYVSGIVDYIDYKTYEITKNKRMDIKIPHTDGAGIYLPRISKKNTMIRLPWIKGLLISVPFDKFINENSYNYPKCGIVKDIYGKEYDILKDDIQIIFTKSQFKMWKYYSSWDEYKDNFKKYNCQAGTCNEEVDDPNFARMNYQFLQTLTDFTDEELKIIMKQTIDNINNIGDDLSVMLKVLGANKENSKKNPLQEAIFLYPEMITDAHTRKMLKDIKKSLVKEGKSGKLFLDGKYSFISPDVYAFMEWLFLKIEKPKGLLADGEVSCSLFKKYDKLDILRSPSLYREHAVRKNVFNEEIDKWFITNALYASTHDLISKLLMYDVDGDCVQIISNKTFVDIAERNMKNIVPLYYEMKKAENQELNNNTIYDGLKIAYSNSTIGLYSNNITRCWNSDDINLDVIKLLCCENNFSIDFAKTLFFLERPDEIDNLISRYTKTKLPHFFVYAKDKEEKSVKKIDKNTIMGKIESRIPSSILRFSNMNLDRFDYKMLMKSKGIIIDKKVTEKYDKLNILAGYKAKDKDEDDRTMYMGKIYYDIRISLLELGYDINDVVDMLIAHSYGGMKINKLTLWSCFGDIILKNLKINLKNSKLANTIYCEKCGERLYEYNNKTKYCDKCAYEEHKKTKLEYWHRKKLDK